MSFLVMCAEKILRLLRLFFVLLYACLCSLLRLYASAWANRPDTGERWNDWPVTSWTSS